MKLKYPRSLPVDGCDARVQGKGGVVVSVLAPDGSLLGNIIIRRVEGVVDAGDDGEEPGQGGKDLIPENCPGVVGLALGERVNWAGVRMFPTHGELRV